MTELLPATEKPNRLVVAIAFVLILCLAGFLRFSTLCDRDFFFDELWITELSSGHGSDFFQIPINRLIDQPNTVALNSALPLWQVPSHITGAIHPPGTFVSLRIWRDLFGDSMWSLRSCSATWSMVTVALTIVAGWISFGRTAGLWAGLLSALSTANIDQAQDVRGYTMLEAFMLFTAIVLIKLRGKTSSWLGASLVGVGTLLTMYTHYFGAGACIAIAVGAIKLLDGKMRRQVLIAMAIAGVVWLTTWWPSFRAQLAFVHSTSDSFLLDHTAFPLGSTALRLYTAPYRAFVADPDVVNLRSLIGGTIVLYLYVWRFRRVKPADGVVEDRALVWFWVWIVAGVLGELLALDLARTSMQLEGMKYFLLINPALCVLMGSVVVWRRWLVPAIASAGLGVTMLVTPVPSKPEYRPSLDFMKAKGLTARDVVVFGSDVPNGSNGQAYYLFVAHSFPTPTQRMAITTGPATPELIASLPRGVKWFFFSCAPFYKPAEWMKGTRIVEAGPASGTPVWLVEPIDAPTSSPTTAPAVP